MYTKNKMQELCNRESVLMSGSGPTVFCLWTADRAGEAICDRNEETQSGELLDENNVLILRVKAMLNFDIQNHKPLREMVYEELKMQILKGSIIPGTRMMEVELAEEMGVSRTPIREAIRKLEKEGLVTIEPRRGAYASMISTEDMVEILEVRQDLEGLAAYFAADG